jgi:5'-deoxynucleotidase YfbR-like HD superfamily hydrolase
MAIEELNKFVHELGHLKQSARTGWWLAGVKQPESVAEHSFRTAALAYFLALQEGANAEHTAILALFHDATEARLGDIPSVGKKYLDKPDEDKVAWDQIAGAPLPVVEAYTSLISEFRERSTPEARLAHDADKLECLAQAIEYAAHGYPRAHDWISASQAALESESGRAMAAAMRDGDPDRWWADFVANYRSAGTAEADDGSL